MELIILYLGLCGLAGFLGKDKSIGAGWAFTISLFFSPLVGIIVALVSERPKVYVPSDAQKAWNDAERYEFKERWADAKDKYQDALYEVSKRPESSHKDSSTEKLKERIAAMNLKESH